MKKLIITCKDEDLVKLVGTCVKIDADFTVETVAVEEPAKRTLHREHETVADKVAAFLREPARKGHATFDQIKAHLTEAGYAPNTAGATLSRLCLVGKLVRSGNTYALLPS